MSKSKHGAADDAKYQIRQTFGELSELRGSPRLQPRVILCSLHYLLLVYRCFGYVEAIFLLFPP